MGGLFVFGGHISAAQRLLLACSVDYIRYWWLNPSLHTCKVNLLQPWGNALGNQSLVRVIGLKRSRSTSFRRTWINASLFHGQPRYPWRHESLRHRIFDCQGLLGEWHKTQQGKRESTGTNMLVLHALTWEQASTSHGHLNTTRGCCFWAQNWNSSYHY